MSLYFCNRLLGFSGIVYSISLSSIKRRIASLSRPDTDLWPKPIEISDLDLGVCRSIDSIRYSMPFALDFCLDSCLTLALARCGFPPLRLACGTLSLPTTLRPRSPAHPTLVRGTRSRDVSDVDPGIERDPEGITFRSLALDNSAWKCTRGGSIA